MAQTEISSPEKFMELVNAFRVSRIILTAHELGIFDFLKNEPGTSTSVARLLGTDPRATDRLMNALVALGLLKKNKQHYTNTGFSDQYLVTGSPKFLGGLAHASHLWKTWNTLTQAVAAGTSVVVTETINDRSQEWRESFLAAMHSRARQQAQEVAATLDLPVSGEILDVGGGSGIFSFAFINASPNLKSIVFDLPNVIPITEKYIQKAGLESAVSVLSGDYLKDEFGTGYAIVFMSAIIHINSPDENRKLIQKGAASLQSNGQLIILDHLMNDERTGPLAGALFALNMLVGTDHGDTFTESEIRSWMVEAGLTSVHRKDTAGGTSLLIGIKP